MSNYPSITQNKQEIQQQREDELSLSSTMMLQKEPSLIEERHNIDVTENTTEHSTTEIDDDDQYGCFVAISPVVSMSHLVIDNDAITGSTEIQLKQLDVQTQRSNNNSATTPPVSPVSSSPLSSPNNTATTSSCLIKTGGGTSCQRRGRFLIWPVTVGPLPLGRSSSSHSK